MKILLDLNYTLVENSDVKIRPFTKQIEGERYSRQLLDRIKKYTIILITARPHLHRDATLKSIQDKLDWQPDAAFFNEHNLPPPTSKRRVLEEHIFPQFGKDPKGYVAIESNPQTRAMYASFGIVALTRATVLSQFALKD